MCDVDAYEAESQTMPELRASYVLVRTIRELPEGLWRWAASGKCARVPSTEIVKEKNTDY